MQFFIRNSQSVIRNWVYGSSQQAGQGHKSKARYDGCETEEPQVGRRKFQHLAYKFFNSLGSKKIGQTLEDQGKAQGGDEYVELEFHNQKPEARIQNPVEIKQSPALNDTFIFILHLPPGYWLIIIYTNWAQPERKRAVGE